MATVLPSALPGGNQVGASTPSPTSSQAVNAVPAKDAFDLASWINQIGQATPKGGPAAITHKRQGQFPMVALSELEAPGAIPSELAIEPGQSVTANIGEAKVG